MVSLLLFWMTVCLHPQKEVPGTERAAAMRGSDYSNGGKFKAFIGSAAKLQPSKKHIQQQKRKDEEAQKRSNKGPVIQEANIVHADPTQQRGETDEGATQKEVTTPPTEKPQKR